MYGRKRYRKKVRATGGYSKKKAPSMRRNYTKRRYRKIQSKWPIWKNPLPQEAKYKFTYQDTAFPLATDLGSSYRANHVFSGNDLFDPDVTGIGVQPYGFDSLCGIDCPFGRYQVFGSKCTVYPHVYEGQTSGDANSTKSFALICTLVPTRNASVTYDAVDDLARMPFSRRRCIENAEDAGGNNILKSYVSSTKMWPEDKTIDAGHSAAHNADPSRRWYWILFVDSNEYANEINMYFDIKITYYTKLIKIDSVDES